MRLLFLDLDTLRPDHLGCYGYHRNTSPNIDRIAGQGIRFNNYYCSDAPCLPSRAALMSGRFGIHSGVVGHSKTAADMRLDGINRGFVDAMRNQGLMSIFRREKMRTVSISPFAERHAAWWFYAGMTEMYNTGQGGMESAEDVTPTVLDWIERNAQEDNWVLHVNYWDPHTPYRAPKDFGNPFADEPLPAWLTEETLQHHREMVGPHKPREISMFDNKENPDFPRHPGELHDMIDMRRMIDGYDCGIRYMDEHIGQILLALEQKGVLDDLAIIITSDHGENMGELGIYGEHATADGITPHIPMIIKWPASEQGIVDNALHYNLDLAPTLAELFGQERQPQWDGDSFATTLITGAECGHDYLVLGQCAHVCQRAVRFDDWVYTRTIHDGFHLFPGEMLYNLAEDPHEEFDLALTRPEICQLASSYLTDWHNEMMATIPDAIDPMWTVMQEGGPCHTHFALENYLKYLHDTGRDWAIPELIRRHGTTS